MEKPRRLHIAQILRYGVVGTSTNLLGYLVYLAVTRLGIEPKLAITIFYPLGVVYGYIAHKRFSFRHTSPARGLTLPVRYTLVYLCGYLLNLGLMHLCHDRLGYSDALVQLFAIFAVATFLFLALKFFVFEDPEGNLPSGMPPH